MQDMGGRVSSAPLRNERQRKRSLHRPDKYPPGKDMKAWELLLSESQERMLLVAEKEKNNSCWMYSKWDLCSGIGRSNQDGMLRFLHARHPRRKYLHELVLGGGARRIPANTANRHTWKDQGIQHRQHSGTCRPESGKNHSNTQHSQQALDLCSVRQHGWHRQRQHQRP